MANNRPDIAIIGSAFSGQPENAEPLDILAGIYHVAYSVEVDGVKGMALLIYEFDERDIIREDVYSTPQVARQLEKYLGGRSPITYSLLPLPDDGHENSNRAAVAKAKKSSTVRVYGENTMNESDVQVVANMITENIDDNNGIAEISELLDIVKQLSLNQQQQLVVKRIEMELNANDAEGEWELHNWIHQAGAELEYIIKAAWGITGRDRG